MISPKERIRQFWDKSPCGAQEAEVAGLTEGSEAFFQALRKRRYRLEKFIPGLLEFDRWKGKKVLDVGCGLGIDLMEFVRSGALAYGVDWSSRSAVLAQRGLDLERHPGSVTIADAESLPFKDESFDFVYSWGVLHHAPDTRKAFLEILRVCKPNGNVLVMVYHRFSLVALQVWIRYGLLKGKPLSSLEKLLARHMESPGTKAFTRAEAQKLFCGLKGSSFKTIVSRFDLRWSRRQFLPGFLRRLVPSCLGWILVIQGRKPA